MNVQILDEKEADHKMKKELKHLEEVLARRNPCDADGNYLKCLVCESIMHFRKDCPHANARKSENVTKTENEEAYKVQDFS